MAPLGCSDHDPDGSLSRAGMYRQYDYGPKERNKGTEHFVQRIPAPDQRQSSSRLQKPAGRLHPSHERLTAAVVRQLAAAVR